MAKNLTSEEKIKKAKTKMKIKTTTKVIMTVIGAVIVIPMFYYIYIGLAFHVFPNFDYNTNNPTGVGYCKPLKNVKVSDDKDYTLAYYYGSCWHVIDDTEQIKANKDKFLVYRYNGKEVEGSQKELYVFRNTDCIVHFPMDSFVLVYTDVFRNCEKKMTMDEFEEYCSEKGFNGVYIFS
jgi:hypothetical protein